MTESPDQKAPESAMPEEAGSTEAGAMPAEKPEEASGATPPSESSGLEAALKAERDARKAAEAELKRLRPQADSAEGLAARVAELENAKQQAERAALVQRIASEIGLPSVLADRMHGDDENSLREDAKRLLEAVPPAQQPPNPETTVGGPQGAPAPGTRSPEEWLSVIRGRR